MVRRQFRSILNLLKVRAKTKTLNKWEARAIQTFNTDYETMHIILFNS